ncbi:hypothetical protein [Streptomyces syringium]
MMAVVPDVSAGRTALATETGRIVAYGRRPLRGTWPRPLSPSP